MITISALRFVDEVAPSLSPAERSEIADQVYHFAGRLERERTRGHKQRAARYYTLSRAIRSGNVL